MRVDIDEARRYDPVARIDLGQAAAGEATLDRNDTTGRNRDIGLERLAAGPVRNMSATNDEIDIPCPGHRFLRPSRRRAP
jgi:hypothetical protein